MGGIVRVDHVKWRVNDEDSTRFEIALHHLDKGRWIRDVLQHIETDNHIECLGWNFFRVGELVDSGVFFLKKQIGELGTVTGNLKIGDIMSGFGNAETFKSHTVSDAENVALAKAAGDPVAAPGSHFLLDGVEIPNGEFVKKRIGSLVKTLHGFVVDEALGTVISDGLVESFFDTGTDIPTLVFESLVDLFDRDSGNSGDETRHIGLGTEWIKEAGLHQEMLCLRREKCHSGLPFGSDVALQHFDRFPWRKTVSSGMWLDFTMNSFPVFACGAQEFEVELQAQPEAGGGM